MKPKQKKHAPAATLQLTGPLLSYEVYPGVSMHLPVAKHHVAWTISILPGHVTQLVQLTHI